MLLHAHGLGLQLDQRWLFRDLSLDLEAGQILWVRGPSGSGKSQLLRRLAGLVDGPGTVTLKGRSQHEIDPPTWRRQVCYVAPELPRQLAATGDALRARIEGLAAQQGAGDDPVRLAEAWGLPPRAWQQPLAQLSSGEGQRLWLAVVLARRPKVLLLDEPTRALDPEATAAVESSLAGRSAVWVSHDPAQGERVASAQLSLGS